MVNEVICRGTIFPTFIGRPGPHAPDGQIPPDFAEFLLASTAAKAGKSLETLMWGGAWLRWERVSSPRWNLRRSPASDASRWVAWLSSTSPASPPARLHRRPTSSRALDGVFAAAAATPGILEQAPAVVSTSPTRLSPSSSRLSPPRVRTWVTTSDLKDRSPTSATRSTRPPASRTRPTSSPSPTPTTSWSERTPTPATRAASLIPVYQYDGSDNVKVTMNFAVGVNVAVAADGVVGFDITA